MVYTADSIFDSKSNRTADSIRDSIQTQKNDSQLPTGQVSLPAKDRRSAYCATNQPTHTHAHTDSFWLATILGQPAMKIMFYIAAKLSFQFSNLHDPDANDFQNLISFPLYKDTQQETQLKL